MNDLTVILSISALVIFCAVVAVIYNYVNKKIANYRVIADGFMESVMINDIDELFKTAALGHNIHAPLNHLSKSLTVYLTLRSFELHKAISAINFRISNHRADAFKYQWKGKNIPSIRIELAYSDTIWIYVGDKGMFYTKSLKNMADCDILSKGGGI